MKRLIDYFVNQPLFAILFTVFVVGLGLYSLFTIRREVFPNVSYDTVTVVTVFAGATPAETEQLITYPLEREIKEIEGIERMYSHSIQSRSTIIMQLDPDVTDEQKAKSDVRDVVDRFVPKLPEGAEEPIIQSWGSQQQPIVQVHVAAEVPELELRKKAKWVKEQLEGLSGLARVDDDLRDIEIRVEARRELLSKFFVSFEELNTALRNQNVSVPGGPVETGRVSSPFRKRELGAREGPQQIIRTTGQFTDLEGVKNTIVRANDLGQVVRVGDVAEVFYELKRPLDISRTNGLPSIKLNVVKKETADAIRLTDAVKARIDQIKGNLPDGYEISFVDDLSVRIQRRLNILSTNLMVGLVLVMCALSLFMRWKVGLLVSLGIPFSFLGTMILFDLWGYSLNLISLMGLVIVSGMLVDDAIVVTENCVKHLENGKSPREAAMLGAQQIWRPVTASVLTTVIVFLPMMFMSGIMGKFIKQIPLAVVVALLISLIEAFFLLPSHIAKWIAAPKKVGDRHDMGGLVSRFWEDRVVPSYLRALRWFVGHRYLAGGGAVFLILAVTGFLLTQARLELFPSDDVEIFVVSATAPTGTSLRRTEALMTPIEEVLDSLPEGELENYYTQVGIHAVGPEVFRRGSEYGQTIIYLTPHERRERADRTIMNEVREKIGVPDGFESVIVKGVNTGPPVGEPVDISVRGKRYEQIMEAVAYLKGKLSEVEGVSDLEDTYIEGKEELRIKVNPVEAAAAGIGVFQIGNSVRAAFEGLVATTVRTLDEEIDVRVSHTQSERATSRTLNSLTVPNRAGNRIPLSKVADVSTFRGLADYAHEEGERNIRVFGQLDTKKTTSSDITKLVYELQPAMREKFPEVSVHVSGEGKDTEESMASWRRAFVVALVGVFMLLVLTFGRLLQPMLLVVVTIPLGIVSIIWAFFLHGMPITFMGLLGMVALSGVIVNNAIVFIDRVNQRRKAGQDRWESLYEAAGQRLRPIFLTSLTTAAGLLPTTYGIGGLDKFVVYITLALSWGLFFGSLMTIFILPMAVSVLDDMTGWRRGFSKQAVGG